MTDLYLDINQFIQEHRWVTGGDLTRKFGKDPEGGCYWDENLLLAPGVSKKTADAVFRLYDAGQITIELISPIMYLLNGIAVDLPYAGELKSYSTPHWFPAAFCSLSAVKRFRETSNLPDGIRLPEKNPRLGWQQWLMKCQQHFQCHRCGECCEGSPVVDLDRYDIERIATHLKISINEMLEEYTVALSKERIRALPYSFPVRGIKKTLPCMFYDTKVKGCGIYPARPLVCRAFPFLETYTIYSDPEIFNSANCTSVIEYFDQIKQDFGHKKANSEIK